LAKHRPGRPPLKPGDRKNFNFTFRSRGELRNQLEAAAARSSRSVSEEIEHRLDRSFHTQELLFDALEAIYGEGTAAILLAIGKLMRDAGRSAGFRATFTLDGADQWFNNPYAYDQVAQGVGRFLQALKPAGEIELPASARMRHGPPELNFKFLAEKHGELFAAGLLAEIGAGETADAALVQRYAKGELLKRLQQGSNQ
jgi:hypothetical protein